MTDLVEFLRARLDEDEAIARAAIADDGGQDGGFEDADFLTDGRMLPRFGEAAAEMIRTFAVPARVLRDVEAKRRIIELHGSVYTLRLLALPYADHPDYREEWKP